MWRIAEVLSYHLQTMRERLHAFSEFRGIDWGGHQTPIVGLDRPQPQRSARPRQRPFTRQSNVCAERGIRYARPTKRASVDAKSVIAAG
jgi:hypothetical protein